MRRSSGLQRSSRSSSSRRRRLCSRPLLLQRTPRAPAMVPRVSQGPRGRPPPQAARPRGRTTGRCHCAAAQCTHGAEGGALVRALEPVSHLLQPIGDRRGDERLPLAPLDRTARPAPQAARHAVSRLGRACSTPRVSDGPRAVPASSGNRSSTQARTLGRSARRAGQW